MTAPDPSSASVLDTHFDDLEAEFAATRRLLERYPAEHAGWKPHEKSMSLGALASHVATLPDFAMYMLAGDEHDMATTPYTPFIAHSAAELVARFEEAAGRARAAVAGAAPGRMGDRWKLRMGEQVFIDDRRGRVLRQHLVSHAAHHRGQLTVYYRLLGVPVPGLYGPSADDMAGASGASGA
jgi:uncharacterized damage-inducible protein DinB